MIFKKKCKQIAEGFDRIRFIPGLFKKENLMSQVKVFFMPSLKKRSSSDQLIFHPSDFNVILLKKIINFFTRN